MSYDMLTTSGINSVIETYKYSETEKRISPLRTRLDKYSRLSSGYDTLKSYLNTFKDTLSDLKELGSSSIFADKVTESSNEDFITATSSSNAISSNYSLRTNQLAKSDIVISTDIDSETANAINGLHEFMIKTGDGEGGEFSSNIEVEFDTDETNKTTLEAIANAINKDKAIVTSSAMDATANFTGTGTFTIDVGETETEIDYDYTNMTYDEVMTDLVDKINSGVKGVTAEKVTENGNVSLKLTVDDNKNYITIDQSLDTGTLLSGAELNIDVEKEKSAAGMVVASAFSPTTDTAQLSITAKNTGVANRITQLSDINGGTALAQANLNIGSSRPTFDQTSDPDTPGFMYADITEENNVMDAKFELNGIMIQRSSNIVDDVVSGVTFTLKSEMDAEDQNTTVKVDNDVEGIKGKIQSFVDNFNDIYTYIKNNSSNVSGTRGMFMGDSNASSILSTLKSSAYGSISGISEGNIDDLYEIGIEFDAYTGLKISDETLLEKKLSEEVEEVESLFNSENGLANTLFDTFEPYLGAGGYLESMKSSYTSNITYLKDKISTAEDSIDESADVMRSQYEQMQMQLTQFMLMQNTYSMMGSYGGYY